MKTGLIGKRRRNRLEELARQANEDPVFDDIIAAEKIKSFFGLAPCENARRLVRGIETVVSMGFKEFEDGKLVYRNKIDNDNKDIQFSYDNALLAIAYLGLGEKQKAEELVKSIEKYIGLTIRQLIGYSTKEKGVDFIPENAVLAFAYSGLGMKEKAFQLIKNTYSIYGSVSSAPCLVTLALAHLGVDECEQALKLKSEAEKQFVKIGQDKLLRCSPSINEINADFNALMAALYYFLGEPENGKKLMQSIENQMKVYDCNENMFVPISYKTPGDATFSSCANSAMAIAYMAREYYEKNEN